MTRTVFLDRDGTLNREVGFVTSPAELHVLPGARDAVRRLHGAGYRIVVVTNQGGIARGVLTEELVAETHRRIDERVTAAGGAIDAWYHCPHHPSSVVAGLGTPCECRKPGRALVDRAVAEFGVDAAASFAVGDRWLDVSLARTVGAKGVLVRTGYGLTEEHRPPEGLRADAVVDNLMGAVSWILRSC